MSQSNKFSFKDKAKTKTMVEEDFIIKVKHS